MANKIKVDFTGVKAYTRCEEGQHVAKLHALEEVVSQNGSDMLAAQFKVIKGESKGAIIYDNFVLTENALWKLKSYLEAVGTKADGRVSLDLDKMLGKVCIIEVAHEEYKGKEKAVITAYKSLNPDPDEDDDDEDEDEKPRKKQPPAKKNGKKPAKKKPVDEDDDDDDDEWGDD